MPQIPGGDFDVSNGCCLSHWQALSENIPSMMQKQPNNDTEMPAACMIWFRFDLRIDDHDGVSAALVSGLPIIPVYIFDENSSTRPLGAASKWWLHHSLKALDKSLRKLGTRLIIRCGDSQSELRDLCIKYNVKTIIYSHTFDPKSEKLDAEIARDFHSAGISLKGFNTSFLCLPNQVRTKSGDPFRMFTPFYRAMVAEGFCDANIFDAPNFKWPVPKVWPQSQSIESLGLNNTVTVSGKNWAQGFHVWAPGELGARQRLDIYVENSLKLYADYRDRPDIEATSKLSPHLRFGEISPHRILHELDKALFHYPDLQGPVEKFRSELAWREFSYGLLAQQPRLNEENFKSGYDSIKWHNNSSDFKAWKAGLTGYTLVDAGMRELWQTGFMHNRVRMVAASFLIKHLLVDWRWGEAWFWDCLVDADPANNAASWQWVAGSGADASPYFRIFNPITQAEKFDPKGLYRNKYIQGFTTLSTKDNHIKSEADLFDNIGKYGNNSHYPQPIIDHSFARQRALTAFDDRDSEL
ncbi:cryptochrome/photolyase family protein [Asticcacaulis machinosus]|uniref:Deoxyribodipyrimidine photo-lyase n=1 Tax=Asticcacaulis machinosus TaxID=2984211 RepID=A0ABT5HF08_9CAUL|nr:deoxyribodipyrimidine photo-lyase [Asticcacaulis machinosus]MDC7674841.1 deoxyribodipyrimidine photo-lyase [Asticcacaulis machinosus]